MVHPGGAPRTVSLSPNDMIALGEEMVKWVKEHPDMLHLSQWYTIEKMYIYKEWKTFIQRPEFIPYYEQALKLIGLKYLDKNSNVRDGISQRWQRSYFQDLTEREDKEANEDTDRKKSIELTKPPITNVIVRADGLGSGISVSAPTLPITDNQSSQ
jgi:hypothetical protein